MKTVPLEEIEPNPFQPRVIKDDAKIEEMVASIKKHGVLQPILVRKHRAGYQIIAGERRYRAAIRAQIKEIPVIERGISDKEMLEISMVENIHREEMTPMEKARGFRRLMEEFKLSQGEVAEIFGMSRPAVANTTRLLGLPKEVQLALESKEITEGHARAIMGIKNEKAIKTVLKRIVNSGMTVRECEKVAKEIERENKKELEKKEEKGRKYEEILESLLGTKVEVKRRGKGGKIEIEFYSMEEIERIIEAIRG